MFIIASPVDNSNDVYHRINDVTNVPVYSRLKQDYINFFLQATLSMYLKLASKIWCYFVSNLQRYDTTKVFHIHLNKFENAVSHLFLVSFGNN